MSIITHLHPRRLARWESMVRKKIPPEPLLSRLIGVGEEEEFVIDGGLGNYWVDYRTKGKLPIVDTNV